MAGDGSFEIQEYVISIVATSRCISDWGLMGLWHVLVRIMFTIGLSSDI
jgi:hypothetical protein